MCSVAYLSRKTTPKNNTMTPNRTSELTPKKKFHSADGCSGCDSGGVFTAVDSVAKAGCEVSAAVGSIRSGLTSVTLPEEPSVHSSTGDGMCILSSGEGSIDAAVCDSGVGLVTTL